MHQTQLYHLKPVQICAAACNEDAKQDTGKRHLMAQSPECGRREDHYGAYVKYYCGGVSFHCKTIYLSFL